jgi:hypothetical protein
MRYISAGLAAVLESRNRQPAYKIYAWNPATVSISAIAQAPSCTHSSIPAPLDLTDYCSELSWSDRQLQFTVIDPGVLFHPDVGEHKNYVKDGAIIRLLEGDETIDESQWIVTFTGQIHGQIGWKVGRASASKVARVSAYGRGETQAFKRRKITSPEYTIGTDIGVALSDICLRFMGLTSQEMRIPTILGRQFRHKVNQLSQVTPWDGIVSLLEVVTYIPFFDGEGKLSYINQNLQRPADKVYSELIKIVELEVPERNQDAINKVRVTFLDAELSKVPGPDQKLGEAQVTTGFFSMGEVLPCWWSEDHKQRAESTYMKVIKSVNSGLLPVGTESYAQIDEFHGEITVEISVWVPILATVMLVAYLAAAAIPDGAAGQTSIPNPLTNMHTHPCPGVNTLPPFVDIHTHIVLPGPVFGVSTISIGRIIQAVSMVGIMLIMMSMGSAQYEVWGTPFDYAYLEKQSIAMLDGMNYWDENEKEIKNDFIGSHEQADTVAVTILIWEQVNANPRRIIMEDDPSIEVGDIIGLPDGRQVVVSSLSKKIKRGETASLTVEGGKVLTA